MKPSTLDCAPHLADTLLHAALVWLTLISLSACGNGGGGASGGVDVPLTGDGEVVIPNAGNPEGSEGTISLEVFVERDFSVTSDDPLVAVGRLGDSASRMVVVRNGRFLRLIVTDDTGAERNVSVAIDDWEAGEVHTVTTTWGQGCTSLFVDGAHTGVATYEGTLQILPGTPVRLGSDLEDAEGAGASVTIQRFRVFGRPLGPEEVATEVGEGRRLVTLRVSNPTVSGLGESATVCVDLSTSGNKVAGTQNDLVWDSSCATTSEISCRVAAKNETRLSISMPFLSTLRAFVFSLRDLRPIPDGPLYCCDFVLEAGRCCPVSLRNAKTSDPTGRALDTLGISGRICPVDQTQPCDR